MIRAVSGNSRTCSQSCRRSGRCFIQYVHLNIAKVQRRFCRGSWLLPPIKQENIAAAVGGVVEWLMAPVLKTGRAQALVGSNPTPSAEIIWTRRSAPLHQVQISCVPDSFSLRFRGIKCGV